MQVVAGSARRIQLKTPPGLDTRPTSGQIKETLFNILQPRIQGCRFLDLFAGSGAIGIEALSRGARAAVFVDHNRQAQLCIRDNLSRTRLEDRARLIPREVLGALKQLGSEKTEPFDIISLDPPYDSGWEEKVLEEIMAAKLAAPDGWIIIEARRERILQDPTSLGLEIFREKEYKNNKHIFIRRSHPYASEE